MGKKLVIQDYKPDDPLPPLFEPGGGMRGLMVRDDVTGAVTPAGPLDTPWSAVGLTKQEWDDAFEIPEFLQRKAVAVEKRPEPEPRTPMKRTMPGMTGSFQQFRVDPEDIERKIRAEADVRWRNWLPTKTDRKRPLLRTYIKQVRKEFYP